MLVKYEIPSIFISSKEIPETRFNKNEFVCYMNEKHQDKFAFIITPAMYRRSKLKNPEYKLIIDDKQQVNISLTSLKDSDCSRQIEEAIHIVYPINKYIEEIFEKDNTTKYKKRQKNVRDIEFLEVSQTPLPEEGEPTHNILAEEVEPKVIKLKKNRKLKPTIILEEEEEAVVEAAKDLSPIIEGNEAKDDSVEFEIELPTSDQKLKPKKPKRKYTKVKFNPPGKTKTKKNLTV